MANTITVMKLNANGKKFSVVYHPNDSMNQYWVYRHSWGLRECGYGMSEKKRIEVKYADMRSCLIYLTNAI